VIISNFSAKKDYQLEFQVPATLIDAWKLTDGRYQLKDMLSNELYELTVSEGKGKVLFKLSPLDSKVFQLQAR